jgi:diaminopimelate epimerase
MKFSKMQGLGNHFVVIDNTKKTLSLSKAKIKQLGNINFGIGFDQLLIVSASTKVDFKYQIFNADGSEVEQCGNGARCFAIFVYEKGLTDKKEIKVETKMGVITLKINDDVNTDKRVTVDMGEPDFEPPSSELLKIKNNEGLYGGSQFLYEEFDFISMGNPHIILKDYSIDEMDIEFIAKNFQEDTSYFPNSVNVNFVEFISENKIKLRTYERGVGETLACGSGACASIVSLRKNNLVGDKVIVEQAGGELLIEYNGSGTVKMTGDAQFVFEGEIEL